MSLLLGTETADWTTRSVFLDPRMITIAAASTMILTTVNATPIPKTMAEFVLRPDEETGGVGSVAVGAAGVDVCSAKIQPLM